MPFAADKSLGPSTAGTIFRITLSAIDRFVSANDIGARWAAVSFIHLLVAVPLSRRFYAQAICRARLMDQIHQVPIYQPTQ